MADRSRRRGAIPVTPALPRRHPDPRNRVYDPETGSRRRHRLHAASRWRKSDVVRIVEGRARHRRACGWSSYSASVTARIVPWVRRQVGGHHAADSRPGPVYLHTPSPLTGENFRDHSEFEVTRARAGRLSLTWHRSHLPQRRPARDPLRPLEEPSRPWPLLVDRGAVRRALVEARRQSLITLKALTYAPTGGIVAAPTTSLPGDRSAGRATGITAIAGFATQPSPSTR